MASNRETEKKRVVLSMLHSSLLVNRSDCILLLDPARCLFISSQGSFDLDAEEWEWNKEELSKVVGQPEPGGSLMCHAQSTSPIRLPN